MFLREYATLGLSKMSDDAANSLCEFFFRNDQADYCISGLRKIIKVAGMDKYSSRCEQ